MFILGCVAAALYLALLSLKIFLSLVYAKKLKRIEATFNHNDLSDITILQPILSGDPLLESTLRYNLEHVKESTFLWLIDQDDTEGLSIAQRLSKTFFNIQVMECPKVPQNANPKLFKLNLGFKKVRTKYIAILDDDTQLSRDSLSVAQQHLTYASIYTGLPYYLPANNFWSSLVSHFVNNNSALTYLPILHFTPAFSINGMFYMLECKTLEDIGGFSAILHWLTDDYAIAKLIHQHHGNIIQGVTTQGVQTSVATLGDYFRIMHRWYIFARVQMNDQKGWLRGLLLVFLALPFVLFWISLITLVFSLKGLVVLSLYLILQFMLIRFLQQHFIPDAARSFFLTSILSQSLQVMHIAHAFLVKRIRWRKRQIQVLPDGHFRYLKE